MATRCAKTAHRGSNESPRHADRNAALNAEAYRHDDRLRERLQRHLAAFERQPAAGDGLRRAAVAVTLVGDRRARCCFVLTLRSSRLRRHAGQYALPGGRLDEGENSDQAALRELDEEVGLTLGADTVLGHLDDFVTRSGFVITPVVVWGPRCARLQADGVEVARIHRVPLAHLDNPDVPRLTPIEESERPVLSLPLPGREVFAPTAAMVYQLREVAVHGRSTRVAHYEQPVWAWR